MNSLILEHTEHGEMSADIFQKLLKNRIVFINGIIDDRLATFILAVLMQLDAENDKKISLYINSDGGDIRNVLMIYDTIQLLKSPVETYCNGAAMFESVLLLAAGTKGLRFMSENANSSIGQLAHNGAFYSDITNAEISHLKIKKDNDQFLKLLTKHTNRTLKEMRIDCERQKFLNASQTKEYGIVDEVIIRSKK